MESVALNIKQIDHNKDLQFKIAIIHHTYSSITHKIQVLWCWDKLTAAVFFLLETLINTCTCKNNNLFVNTVQK